MPPAVKIPLPPCDNCGRLQAELALARPWRPEIPQKVFCPDPRTPIVLESPFAGDLARNARYLDACILDALERGESPYASHRMLTRSLNDNDPAQREVGLVANKVMIHALRRVAFYLDFGMTPGMQSAADWAATQPGVVVVHRRLGLHKGW